ncbi:MAG: hypothetical protein WCS77_03815 [Elusimicrobiaceae bacterium]
MCAPVSSVNWQDLLIPPAGLAINTAVQILCVRRKTPLLKSVYAGFAAGLVFTVTAAFRNSSGLSAALADAVIYAGLGYCYFHFVNLGETARRIRIMREIYEAPAPLTEEGIAARYSAREMLDKRLRRLLANSQIAEKNGKLFINRKSVLIMERILTLLKIIFTGRDSEHIPSQ